MTVAKPAYPDTPAATVEEAVHEELSRDLEKQMKKSGKGRKKGTGYLRRLPSGVYQARWTDRITGELKTRSTGTKNKAQAEKQLNIFTAYNFLKTVEARAVAVAESFGNPAEKVRLHLDKLPALGFEAGFEAFRTAWKLKRPSTGERSYKNYRGHLAALEAWIRKNAPGVTELRYVTRKHAADFLAALAIERDTGTYKKHLTFFKCMWRVLADNEEAKLKENPWEKFDAPAHRMKERRELTVQELASVCGSVEGEMRLLFAVGIYTGLRLWDCAMLQWGAVDLARGVIRLTPHKIENHVSARPVMIPIHHTLAAMLDEIPHELRSGYVMPETAADYMRDKGATVSRRIQHTFTKCGIKTTEAGDEITEGERKGKHKRARILVGFHSLRHTYVSLSANAGVPLAVVQAIVGHSNPAMTRHYYHADTKALTAAVAALPDIIEAEVVVTGAKPSAAMAAFQAAVDALAPEDLAAARAYLDKRGDGHGFGRIGRATVPVSRVPPFKLQIHYAQARCEARHEAFTKRPLLWKG